MKQVEEFATGPYAAAKATYPKVDQATVQGSVGIISYVTFARVAGWIDLANTQS